jgi:ribose transport system ATP-binding protein
MIENAPHNVKPLLTVRNINKAFPGVQALTDVSLDLYPNEVVGLVGENGAGKSTLMRILAGVYGPDSGEIRIDGELVHLNSPQDATNYGIGMVFQEQSQLPNLSVGENIYLGQEGSFSRFGIIQWSKLYEAARRQLAKVKTPIDPATRSADLSFAQRQMVELAKALVLEERTDRHLIILLDEPTSVLESRDIEILFERLRELKQRASFIFVSHRLDEVLAASDRIYVMKDGHVIAQRPAAEANVSDLHHLMVGRGLQAEYYRESKQKAYNDQVVLETKQLSLKGEFRDVSFNLHAGEILGIAGVIGSGREALLRTLFGFQVPTTGEICINTQSVHFQSPSDAVKLGIGYIPQERRNEGLVLFLSVATNMTLASLGNVMRNGIIQHDAETALAHDWVDKLSIRTPSIRSLCLNLSGGNQQKVVLAKWMNAQSRIMILDHPTRGLDVGAKEEVYDLVRELTNQGVSVILAADTLEETIGLSHTILVMRDGAITQRFEYEHGKKPTQIDLIKFMV